MKASVHNASFSQIDGWFWFAPLARGDHVRRETDTIFRGCPVAGFRISLISPSQISHLISNKYLCTTVQFQDDQTGLAICSSCETQYHTHWTSAGAVYVGWLIVVFEVNQQVRKAATSLRWVLCPTHMPSCNITAPCTPNQGRNPPRTLGASQLEIREIEWPCNLDKPGIGTSSLRLHVESSQVFVMARCTCKITPW